MRVGKTIGHTFFCILENSGGPSGCWPVQTQVWEDFQRISAFCANESLSFKLRIDAFKLQRERCTEIDHRSKSFSASSLVWLRSAPQTATNPFFKKFLKCHTGLTLLTRQLLSLGRLGDSQFDTGPGLILVDTSWNWKASCLRPTHVTWSPAGHGGGCWHSSWHWYNCYNSQRQSHIISSKKATQAAGAVGPFYWALAWELGAEWQTHRGSVTAFELRAEWPESSAAQDLYCQPLTRTSLPEKRLKFRRTSFRLKWGLKFESIRQTFRIAWILSMRSIRASRLRCNRARTFVKCFDQVTGQPVNFDRGPVQCCGPGPGSLEPALPWAGPECWWKSESSGFQGHVIPLRLSWNAKEIYFDRIMPFLGVSRPRIWTCPTRSHPIDMSKGTPKDGAQLRIKPDTSFLLSS